MGTTDIEKYGATMKEIKLRMEVINLFLSGQRDAHYLPTSIETIGLQFRKVFELIAFASLAANRDQYSLVYADFAEHWQAAKLLKNLSKINSDFYPVPIIETPPDQPLARPKFKPRDQDYLAQEELVEAHGRCGALMHSANPFGDSIDYKFFQQTFPIWTTKIVNLLNSHAVRLLGDTGFWLFHMHEEGKENEVSWYRFEPYANTAVPAE